ncbi:MAG: hypothetical protein NTY99_00400 [DPANN group archaeon]|nr:hypothetical protein [DPANN group archaeon]
MDAWDGYFASLGYNLEELNKPRNLGLKFGQENVFFDFTVKNFMIKQVENFQKISQSRGLDQASDFNNRIDRWFACTSDSRAASQLAFWYENPNQQEMRIRSTGFFKRKPTQIPNDLREILLFEDETLQPVNIPLDNAMLQRTANNTPMIISPVDYAVWNAGVIYNTGRRLIFDVRYKELEGDFPIYNQYGCINMSNLLKCFNMQSINLTVFDGKKKLSMPAVANVPVVEEMIYLNQMTIGGIVPVSTSRLQVTNVNGYYIGPNGERGLRQTYETYSGPIAPHLEKELGKLKETDLIDLIGMMEYATTAKKFGGCMKGRI